jgi:UDP-2,3-diacylglucosamine hydrolase
MIGLIFGSTKLPFEILKEIKKKKLKYLIIDLSKKKIFSKNKHSHSVSIGQFGKIINILKENKCKKILFAGKVEKPNFSKIKLDIKGIYYMPRIIRKSKLGDAAILKEIIKIFKEEKITTINSLTYNFYLKLKKATYSKLKPDKIDKIDIKKGLTTLKSLKKYSFSQAVVIRSKKILAVEGKSGTKKMLLSIKRTSKKSGILIKFPKEKQDLRIDLPTVGIETFKQCKSAGLKGVVLKSNQNIFLEKKKCIKYANKHKMFVTIV